MGIRATTAISERPAGTRSDFGPIPPRGFLIVSAVFYYLGPSFAVMLFAVADPLGVAWMRIVSAALVFGAWRRPWRRRAGMNAVARRTIAAWGAALAAMNCCFYLAIARLPLGTVAAIKFAPVIVLAALGSRTRRNSAAPALAVAGVYPLTHVVWIGQPLGLVFAFTNAVLFAAYVVMLLAAVLVTAFAAASALPAVTRPVSLLAGIGLGVSSPVIPYVTDQWAMSRGKRSTYALLISLLPATATAVGLIVLRQVPTPVEVAGIDLVIAAVALHRDEEALSR